METMTLEEYREMREWAATPDTEAQHRGAQNKASGKRGQSEAECMLRALGARMVEEIATPTRAVRGKTIYAAKVSADINAIMGDGTGRRILAEVKSTTSDTLGIGKLKSHQQERLQENNELNGVSLVVWIAPHGSYVLRWPVEGWKKGKPLDEGKAARLNVEGLG